MKKALIYSFCLAGLTLAATLPAAATEIPVGLSAATTAKPIDWTKVYANLNLSTEQAERINQIRELFDKQAKFLKDQIKAKQGQIQGQLNAGAPSTSRLTTLMNEKLALESQLQKAALDSFLAIQKVLTPQQLAQLRDQLKKNNMPQSGVVR